jgi:hypothetical protein
MSEGEAFLALREFIRDKERVTFYLGVDDNLWYCEWFTHKGGFNWHRHENFINLIEEITK